MGKWPIKDGFGSLPSRMPRKIVINVCYGGFSLSDIVKDLYNASTKDIPKNERWFIEDEVERDDPILIEIIERVGLIESAGPLCELQFVEVPDDLPSGGFVIMDYDGKEWIAEKHREWFYEPGANLPLLRAS